MLVWFPLGMSSRFFVLVSDDVMSESTEEMSAPAENTVVRAQMATVCFVMKLIMKSFSKITFIIPMPGASVPGRIDNVLVGLDAELVKRGYATSFALFLAS